MLKTPIETLKRINLKERMEIKTIPYEYKHNKLLQKK